MEAIELLNALAGLVIKLEIIAAIPLAILIVLSRAYQDRQGK